MAIDTEYQLNVDESLRVITESITRMISSPGVYVQFSGSSSAMNPLKEALADVLEKYSNKQLEKLKNISKETAEAQAQAYEEASQNIAGIIDKKQAKNKANIGSISDAARHALSELKNGNKASMSFTDKFMAYSARTIEIGKDIYQTVKNIGTKLANIAATNIDFASSLRESGVLIKEGFDEGFIKYANMAGKDREAFIELARENSRFIASMNGAGGNGVEMLSKESKKLVGQLGLSRKEIDASLKHYNETMMTAANQADIANFDHETNLIKSTKALKMFALATGQSYENLVKEKNEREKTWQMQRLATDQRTAAQFKMLKSMGMSDDQIEAIMLGKANKASVMAQLDPDSAALFSSVQNAYRSSKGNPEAFSRALGKISNSGAANNLRRRSANINVEDFAYFQGEEIGNVIDPSNQWAGLLSSTFDQQAEGKMYDKEAQTLNDVQSFYADVNSLQNTLKDSMSPNLSTIAEWLPKLSAVTDAINTTLAEHPWLKSVAGFLGVGGIIAKGLADSIIPYLIMSKIGGLFKLGGSIGTGVLKTAATGLKGAITSGGKFLIHGLGSVFKGFLPMLKGAAGILGKVILPVVSLFQTGGVLKDFFTKGVGASIDEYKKEMNGPLDYILNPSKSAAIFGGWVGDGIGNLLSTGSWSGNTEEERLEKSKNQIAEMNAKQNGTTVEEERRKIDAAFNNKNKGPAVDQTTTSTTTSSESTQPQNKISKTDNTVSISGMGGIESILNSINDNTRALVNEIRNAGFNVGTNLAG